MLLRKTDESVHAFFSPDEAVAHTAADGPDRGDVESLEFFDAQGRKLRAVRGSGGDVEGLAVETEDDHSDAVRERVRKRFDAMGSEIKEGHPDADSALAPVLDEKVVFELFAWRLADLLRPENNAYDPAVKPEHRGSWWHNMIAH